MIILLSCVHAFGQVKLSDGLIKHRSPTHDDLHNGFFVSDKKGWIISHQTGLVLHTRDGGKNWTIQSRLAEGYLESVNFTDEKHGWLCGDQGRIYKTINGGKNWSLSGSFEKTFAFYAVHFFDKKRGFVAGLDSKTRRGLFFETSDAGRSWQNRAKDFAISGSLSDAVFFLDKQNGFVAGTQTTHQTNDGGKSWKASQINAGGFLRGLFFQNKQNGWAVGHQGLLLKFTGGSNWERKSSFSKSILRSIWFFDEKHGYIGGNRDKAGVSLWQTTDGGETWRAVTDDLPNLHRLVPSKGRLWIIGASGTILSLSR